MLDLKVEDTTLNLEMASNDSANMNAEPGGGVTNYSMLDGKPQINGVTLEGNKTFPELGLTTDAEPTAGSTNPVQSGGVASAISELEGELEQKQDALTFDEAPTAGSTNPVTSGGVYNSLSGKQDTLTFDDTPTEGSTNPVTSSGIAESIADVLETLEPHIDVMLWPLGINAILVIFRGFALYSTFSALAASREFAVAIQKTVNVYSGTIQNYIGQATIFAGLNGGVSANWTIWMADAIYMNGDYADGFSGVVTYNNQTGDWYLANPVMHKPLYFELLESKENVSNKVQSIASASTSSEYPSAKAVYDAIPKKTSDLTNDSGFVNANEAANAAPVQSVNGKTGAVSLSASDVGALPDSTFIPTKTTDLVNDSGFVDATEAADAAPVQSVNGKTGSVSLGASDVGALPDTTAIPTKTSDLANDSDFITETETDTKLAMKADSAGASADYAAKLTASIPYGECDSTSTSTAYTATVPGITELKDGVCMLLYNGVVTSASGFTIDINGLGAKPSYSNMAMGNSVTPTSPTRDTTIFNINYAFLFIYSATLVSGGCWIGYRGYDANTNTIGYQLRTNNSTMKAADKFYRYRLLFTSADGTKWVPANTSTSTNATAVRTPNTRAIDPFGEIVWYGTTTAIEANANVTAAQLWQEYYGSYTNIGYSFNNTGAAQTMTANLPIYIKCTPQADGSAIIDPTTPYTQSLPTTDDGKIYIYLGRAYNATNFEITMNHPVYYHDGAGIKLWTGGRQMPNPPSTDGTYTLQCTVSNGVATYSWI